MKTAIILGLTCLGMIGPSLQSTFVSLQATDFIEARLCATGRIIRIPIGEDEDDAPDQMRACHALCSRNSDVEDPSDKGSDPRGSGNG